MFLEICEQGKVASSALFELILGDVCQPVDVGSGFPVRRRGIFATAGMNGDLHRCFPQLVAAAAVFHGEACKPEGVGADAAQGVRHRPPELHNGPL